MKSKLRLTGAVAALLVLALAASCRGFFVNPTLTAVSVGPQNLSINVNQTWPMAATGTFSDGTQKQLNSGVVWSSSDGNTVSVGQTSGMVTGIQVGSATISASSGSCSSCSGSTSVTVLLQGVTSITVTGAGQTVHISTGEPAYFTATAQPNGVDITNAGAVWTVVDSLGADQTSAFNLSFLAGSGEGIAAGSAAIGTYTVRATYNGKVGTATLNVAN